VVVNQAVAGGAISPNTKQNYILAIIIGLGLPFALLVLMEVLNNKIQSKDDIDGLTKIPLIGTVGHVESKDTFVVAEKPRSAVAESFRSIRSNLNYFTDKSDHKVFMITSSVSGEGKTFTTINLATIIAFSGKKTVIIGADLRRPRIYGDFDLSNDFGLSTYLSGGMNADEIVQETKIENLFLISAGPVPPNPSELLMKVEMEDLLNKLKTEFDYVIIDTPPVGLVTDAFILSAYADHSLFMTRQNFTPKAAITSINELFEQQKIEHVSIVFNDLKNMRPGYGYANGYGYGYGYGAKNGDGYYDEGNPSKKA
jgi:capsular exopolysaccharide synthesis family protein